MTLTYSITEDVVTPESAEQGDFAHTGFVVEPAHIALRDLVYEVRARGIAQIERTHNGLRVTHFGSTDCSTGGETTETTHITCAPSFLARLRRLTTLELPAAR